VEVENFCTKLPKGTPLRQIWWNKLFGLCGSDVVLTLYGDEKKKVRGNRHWKIDVVYNTINKVDLTYYFFLCDHVVNIVYLLIFISQTLQLLCKVWLLS